MVAINSLFMSDKPMRIFVPTLLRLTFLQHVERMCPVIWVFLALYYSMLEQRFYFFIGMDQYVLVDPSLFQVSSGEGFPHDVSALARDQHSPARWSG